jgi:hypothetical protein
MTTLPNVVLSTFVVPAFCISFATVAAAQEEEEETGWAQSAELSLVATSGNSESTTFALKYALSREWEKSRFKASVAGLRAESDTGVRFAMGTSPDDFVIVDPRASEVTAESYSASGRYERDVSERRYAFVGAGWERNEFAGVANRFVAEAGGGNVWWKRDRSHFETSYALTGTRQEDVVAVPADSENFLGVRLSLDFLKGITKAASYTALLVVDENLDDTSDLRANLEQGFAVTVNDRLKLKTVLQVLFDNDPSLEALPLRLPDGSPAGVAVLVPLDDVDTIFKTALVIDF